MDRRAPSKILSNAADLLEKYGWTQNAFRRKDGAMCLTAAICRANHGAVRYGTADFVPASKRWREEECMRHVWSLLQRGNGDRYRLPIVEVEGFLEVWNDTSFRLSEQVIDVLRRASRLAWIRENDLDSPAWRP